MDLDKIANTAILKGECAQRITCEVTGGILDYRTAVLLESGATGRTLACISPEGWALRKDSVLAAMPDVRVITLKPR